MNNLYEIITENPSLSHNGESLMTAVYEYYAGRSKELIKCEGYLNNIVNKIGVGENDFDFEKTPISRSDKDHRALEQELAKFFKVKEVCIYWEGGSINAYTVCNSKISTINAKKNLFDGKGNNMKINIFIYQNMVSACGLTGGELLAIILHEIGHNFYWCPVQVVNEIVLTVCSLGTLPLLRFIVKGMYKIKGEVKDWIRDNVPVLQNVADAYNRLVVEFGLLNKPFTAINNVLTLMTNPGVIAKYIANSNPAKYGEEKGADSFAAKYGYGPEQASALRKMSAPENSVYGEIIGSTSDIGNIIGDLVELECDIVSMVLMDPHPNVNQRAASMLDKLEKDYKKGDYSPAAKKELEREIKRMREAYDNAVIISTNEDGPNIRKGLYAIIDDATGGHSDLREVLNFYYNSYRF